MYCFFQSVIAVNKYEVVCNICVGTMRALKKLVKPPLWPLCQFPTAKRPRRLDNDDVLGCHTINLHIAYCLIALQAWRAWCRQ